MDGDLLKLVHLSNSFSLVDGRHPLAVGDLCLSEARIVSVVKNDSRMVARVKGCVLRAVVEVVSAFLYYGRTDFEITFEIIEEPNYVVVLVTDMSIGVLLSKEWFQTRVLQPDVC